MYIDGINIKTFKSTLLKKVISNSEVITYQDWLRKSFDPTMSEQLVRYIDIYVKVLVEGDTGDEVLTLISTIINECKKCVLSFTGNPFFFNCTLESSSNSKVIETVYELELNFKASHKKKSEITETANRVSSKTINVPGNLDTPAILEITPSIDIIDIAITGLSDTPITVKNLKAGKKVVLNGEDGTVLESGLNKFTDTDMWEFPRLKPGANTISFSKNNCDITIKYKPRWI